MSRQHWHKKVRLLDLSGRSSYITEPKAQKLIDAGDAELLYEVPLTIRIIDKVEYLEELRYQRGRRVEVSKCPSLSAYDKFPDQDWEGEFELPDRATTGRKSLRCRPPRHPICEDEREYQRYKTRVLRNKSEEEAERVRVRSAHT